MVDGLRARRLFSAAETYCKERLGWAEIPPERRIDLAILWSKACADLALESKAEDAPLHWKRAQEALAAPAAVPGLSDRPRMVLVWVQEGLLEMQQGEANAQAAALLPQRTDLAEPARDRLREAVRKLRKQGKYVAEQLNQFRPGGPQVPGALTEREWISLQQNLRRHLARGDRLLAETYPPASADRLDLLNQAIKELDPVADGDSAEPFTLPARLERAACLRLSGRTENAAPVLAALEKEPLLHPALRTLLLAERIRAALALLRAEDAVQLAVSRPAGMAGLELDLACLEAYVAGWSKANAAGQAEEATKRQQAAGALVTSIGERYGPYWGRRATILEAALASSDTSSADPDTLARAADNLYVSGQVDEAIHQYDRASQAARRGGKAALAFDLAYKAAAVEHKRKKSPEAAKRFLELAISAPENPRAAESHLWGVYHLGQASKGEGEAPSDLSGYEKQLQEHLTRWPASPTASQARLWLGKVYEAAGELKEAAELYAGVKTDDPRFVQAIEALDRVCARQAALLRDGNEPVEPWIRQSAEWFAHWLPLDPAAAWSEGERKAALSAAKYCLDDALSKFDEAANMLAAAIKTAPAAEKEWLFQARRLLILAEAGRGRTAEAAQQLAALGEGNAKHLLDMLDGLSGIAADASPAARKEVAKLQLESIKLLESKSSELSEAEQKLLNLTYARAVGLAENKAKALAIYATLVKTYPLEGKMHEEYALLLMDDKDPANLKAAAERWTALERGSKPGSDRWFRAKYHLARCQALLGDKAAALKQIDVLEILHPDLGGAAWKPRFDQLRKEYK